MLTGCITKEESNAIEEVMSDFPNTLDRGTFNFRRCDSGFSVTHGNPVTEIAFSTRTSLMRAVSVACRGKSDVTESPAFSTLALMLDNSRNAVMNAGAFKKMCRLAARMGYNVIMLYIEDTYTVDGYPYFGYMRGRFTDAELREYDEYASALGIELVGCIQTLAHLNQALRWQAFSDINDIDDILLADEEKTYKLIDSMLEKMSATLKSRRLHIGMDEAHRLGLGKHLEKYGYERNYDIMKRHLNRVCELCEKHGLKPYMWSDMFFRMCSPNGGYLNLKAQIPEDVIESVPPELTLCYWDYYSTDPDFFGTMMEKHRVFNNPVMFAGGAWIWQGPVPLNRFSRISSEAALKSAVKHGIKEVMVTMWGDDGAECSRFASLTTLLIYAERCWSSAGGDKNFAERMKMFTGAEFDDIMALSDPNFPPCRNDSGEVILFPTKAVFYQDILSGIYDRHVSDGDGLFYKKCAEKLKAAAARNIGFEYIFETLSAYCSVLEIKAEFGKKLKKAYDAGDIAEIKALSAGIGEMIFRTEKLYSLYRTQWLHENKTNGLEVLAIRFGGMKQRMEDVRLLLDEYTSGKRAKLEELETERLFADCREDDRDILFAYRNIWSEIVTVNHI